MTVDDFINDIPESAARAAHQWTSHVPEARARQECMSYAETLAADWFALAGQTDGDADKLRDLREHFEWYRRKYQQRYLDYLAARSRCASTMITGGSGFNTRRNDKANDAADKRREELIAFWAKALATIRKILTPELQPIRSGDDDAVERLQEKLAALIVERDEMKLANATIRKHARAGRDAQIAALGAIGFGLYTAEEMLTPDALGYIGFPPFKLTNIGAEIRRVEARLTAVQTSKALAVETIDGANARMEDCPAENRVRLFFPGKPAADVRTRLKSCGFRWTPSLGCWQAYRNPRSIETAKREAGETGRPPEAEGTI